LGEYLFPPAILGKGPFFFCRLKLHFSRVAPWPLLLGLPILSCRLFSWKGFPITLLSGLPLKLFRLGFGSGAWIFLSPSFPFHKLFFSSRFEYLKPPRTQGEVFPFSLVSIPLLLRPLLRGLFIRRGFFFFLRPFSPIFSLFSKPYLSFFFPHDS